MTYMPFDPFFSSKNKHHYVRSEKYQSEVEPEVKRILALPKHEIWNIMSDLNERASKRELTLTEHHVRKRLQFIWLRKHRAIQNINYRKRIAAQRKKGAALFGGYNTT